MLIEYLNIYIIILIKNICFNNNFFKDKIKMNFNSFLKNAKIL